ncbi:MAG: ferritin family protein [Sandaracinaceae bacterium]|nr:ferritin family protein [Sandaracinaceae bacterium]
MTTKVSGLDFSKLTLLDALDLAVLIEEEAMDRYRELAEQLEVHNTHAAAKFFRFMERNEAKHREALLTQRTARFADAPRHVRREMIFDIEAPEYDEARTFMSLRAALEVSMRSETKAREFFESALAQISDSEVRTLFAELRDEEIEHQGLVQKELDKVGSGAPGDPEDYADEPVSH